MSSGSSSPRLHLFPGPALRAGVSPLPHLHGTTEGGLGHNQRFCGCQNSSLDKIQPWGERMVCPDNTPHPHTLTQAGHRLGGATSGKAFPVIGKEEPFLASDTSFPQPFPASRTSPWPLDTQGPGPEWPGKAPEAGTFLVHRGLALGVSVSSPLEAVNASL